MLHQSHESTTTCVRTAMQKADGERRAGDMIGKGSSTAELLYGSLSGMAFGLVSPIAGQPFDLIKTKMQADVRFSNSGAISVWPKVMYSGLKASGACTAVCCQFWHLLACRRRSYLPPTLALGVRWNALKLVILHHPSGTQLD